MFGRVTTYRWETGRDLDAAKRFVDETLVPAMQRMPGFKGYTNVLDEQAGKGTAITLFESREQAEGYRTQPGMEEVLRQLHALGVTIETAQSGEVIRHV